MFIVPLKNQNNLGFTQTNKGPSQKKHLGNKKQLKHCYGAGQRI